jgi:endonuclease YncB( thermonuclease family)
MLNCGCLRFICVLVLMLVASELLDSPRAQAPSRGSGTYAVTGPVRVIEADTLEVFIDGRRVGVTIAGIAVPPGNVACGRQAAALVQSLVEGGIELQEDYALPTFDRRRLRVYRVFDRTGRLIAEELARAGFALPDERAPTALDRATILAAAAEASGRAIGCASTGRR